MEREGICVLSLSVRFFLSKDTFFLINQLKLGSKRQSLTGPHRFDLM